MPAAPPVLTVTVARPAKAWYRSRTLWLNVAALMLLAAEAKFALLQPLLPANVYACIAFALPVANAALRLITTTALSVRSLSADAAARDAATEVQVPALRPLAEMRAAEPAAPPATFSSRLDFTPTIPVDVERLQ